MTALPRKLSQDHSHPPVNSFRGRAFYNLSLTAHWNVYTGWLHKIMIQSTTWWRHQMETFSVLLAICAGNSPAPGEFPAQRPVTRSFDVFFDLHLNKRLSKQSWGWWFEMLPCPLWRHCNDNTRNRGSLAYSTDIYKIILVQHYTVVMKINISIG